MKRLVDGISFCLSVPFCSLIIGTRLLSALIQLVIIIPGFLLLTPVHFLLYWLEDGFAEAVTEIKRYPSDLIDTITDTALEAICLR